MSGAETSVKGFSRFPHHNPPCASVLPRTCHMTRPSYYDYDNDWKLKIMKKRLNKYFYT
jgi:hypothetical protein